MAEEVSRHERLFVLACELGNLSIMVILPRTAASDTASAVVWILVGTLVMSTMILYRSVSPPTVTGTVTPRL